MLRKVWTVGAFKDKSESLGQIYENKNCTTKRSSSFNSDLQL